MSKCLDIRPVEGCFTVTATGEKIPVVVHYIYQDNGSIGQAVSLPLGSESPIDVATYLGGGEVKIGACDVSSDRNIYARMRNGDTWDIIERTTTTNNISIRRYLDPDTSPMADVTSNYGTIIRGSKCQCGDEDAVVVIPTIPTISFNNTTPTSGASTLTGTISTNNSIWTMITVCARFEQTSKNLF